MKEHGKHPFRNHPKHQHHLFFIKGGRTKRAFFQASMVSICMLVVLMIACVTLNGFLITSLAASAFIAFAFPLAESSRPRYLVGGYVCGIAAGLLGSLIYNLELEITLHPHSLLIISCAVAAFVATLLMVFFGMQHPPAAALAVSIVFDKQPLYTSLIAFVCIVVLVLIKWLVLYLMKRNHLELPGEELEQQEKLDEKALSYIEEEEQTEHKDEKE